MADHAEPIANFVAVSGAIPEKAQFYFEANSWYIDAVTSRFYEEPQAGAGSGGRDNRGASRVAEEDEDLDDVMAHSAPKPASKKKVSAHF
ncbi:hypothetical protein BGZ89_012564 [Linnemannia elongata]|nr:hypothetical protein BGZ89_012564 [Linnemannia elongata]